MSIKDCLLEVQSAVKDFLSKEEAEELLLTIKNNIELKKGSKKIEESLEKITKEVLNDVEISKKVEALNRLKDREKVIQLYKYIDEVWNDNPMAGVKAILVGLQDARRGAKDSVDGAIVDYQNRYMGFFHSLQKYKTPEGINLLDVLNQKALHKEIIQEVMDNPYLTLTPNEKRLLTENGLSAPQDKPLYANKNAYEVAKLIKEWNEIVVRDKNDLGAWISMLPGYVFRQSHLPEKMLRAAGGSIKEELAHKAAWIEFVLPRLDRFKTFQGANPEEFLSNVWDNILSGQHIKTLEAGQHFGSKNIAKRQSAERVLHFKDGKSFYDYDQKFGNGDLKTSLFFGLNKAGQDNGMMSKLGTNPENTVRTLIDLLKKKNKGLKAQSIDFSAIEKEFLNLNGAVNHISSIGNNATVAKIGAGLRTLSTTGKLTALPVTSIADIAYMMSEAGFHKIPQVDFFKTLFKELKRTRSSKELKDLLEPLGLFTDSFSAHFSEHFTLRENATGAFNTYQSNFFKYLGFNGLMRKYKSAMALALQNHYGKLTSKSWNKLDDQYRSTLSMYNIDEAKWNMIRKTSLKDFEGNKYLTIEKTNEISDADALAYFKKKNPQYKKITNKQINDVKKDIQSNWRVFIHDRIHQGIIEPGRREKAIMNRGFRKGTIEGELYAMLWHFKSFSLSVYTKPIERALKSYAPGTSTTTKISSLVGLGITTTFWGYIALSIGDMLAGKEPRDPKNPKTLMAAFMKGGGGGIYFDMLQSEFSRSNGGALTTIAGPVYSDLHGFGKVLSDTVQGKFDKAGLKAFRLFEANTPVDAWFIRPAYQALIGYQVKEMLDPGYFRRLERNTKKRTGQDFYNYIKP